MADFNRAHVYSPYPELVECKGGGAPYEIRDALAEPLPTRGMVDLRKRLMWVPLLPSARAVTRHEMGHVRFSPLTPTKVRFDVRLLMAVEDARINLALAALGLPVVLDIEGHNHVVWLLAQDAMARDGFAQFMRAIASLGTSVEDAIEAQLLASPGPLGELIADWMTRARSTLETARLVAGAEVAPYSVGVALAGELAHYLRALGLLDERLRARSSRAPTGCCVRHPDGGLLSPEEGGPVRGDLPEKERAAVQPGRMEVKKAPLSVPLRPGQQSGRRWRASTEGSVVRYLARWPVDRAVFRRRGRCSGGTTLVDTSGSMSLEVTDLDRLLLATPLGMRVAIYSGSGAVGELRIVADGGRRATAEHLGRFGSGNIVDLPALEWLAHQPLPRFWISDGVVTGVGDKGSEVLKRRCAALCKRARIRRVGKLDEAAALLRGARA